VVYGLLSTLRPTGEKISTVVPRREGDSNWHLITTYWHSASPTTRSPRALLLICRCLTCDQSWAAIDQMFNLPVDSRQPGQRWNNTLRYPPITLKRACWPMIAGPKPICRQRVNGRKSGPKMNSVVDSADVIDVNLYAGHRRAGVKISLRGPRHLRVAAPAFSRAVRNIRRDNPSSGGVFLEHFRASSAFAMATGLPHKKVAGFHVICDWMGRNLTTGRGSKHWSRLKTPPSRALAIHQSGDGAANWQMWPKAGHVARWKFCPRPEICRRHLCVLQLPPAFF